MFFSNKQLLKEALTHKSYCVSFNNERLEFLGDAILQAILTDILYQTYPILQRRCSDKVSFYACFEEASL